MSELVTDAELSNALDRALGKALQLAAVGGERSVPFNAICNSIVGLLADLLAQAPITTDLDHLTALFRVKLEEAIERRREGVRH